MRSEFRHIAFFVPDLQGAEAYYRDLFDMEILMRETEGDDGLWYTLPADKEWADAAAAGIELKMVALKKEDILLVLFSGTANLGQVHTIGLTMTGDQMARVRSHLPEGTDVTKETTERLEIRDRYGIVWQIWQPQVEFQPNGISGRWLSV